MVETSSHEYSHRRSRYSRGSTSQKRIHYKIGSKANLGTKNDTFDLETTQLTDLNVPSDETETTNEFNSISSIPTSTTHSPATNRRIHIRNTHQLRGGHHQSNTGKDGFINMW